MSAVAEYSPSNLQAERSKCNKHENLIYSFGDTVSEGTTLTCGDVAILHNLALLFKMKDFEKKYQNTISRFHIITRTMRRSKEWDWVKPEHIKLILSFLHEIHENIDEVVAAFQEGQAFQLEKMEADVASGVMSEGDYIYLAKGMKLPHDFIAGKDFKRWVAHRAEFYETLNGEMPKLQLIFLPHHNENDGKAMIITA